MCGKRLAVAIQDNRDLLMIDPRLEVPKEHWNLLCSMSPATMDRHLKPFRDRERLKGLCHTRSTTALKNLIPIRTGADWSHVRPGHFQVDTVGHDGGSRYGQFCFTINAVDVFSGWTESRALLNKAKRWVVESVQDIKTKLPFALLSIHTDNGGEFINKSLFEACQTLGVEMTRSRPDKKNDNCYVECRNDDVVIHFVGYSRFSSEPAQQALAEVWKWAMPLLNNFHPSMRQVSKKRVGGKVRKQYDRPQTPYQRLIDSPDLPQSAKVALAQQRITLNLIDLKINLENAVDALLKLAEPIPRGSTSQSTLDSQG